MKFTHQVVHFSWTKIASLVLVFLSTIVVGEQKDTVRVLTFPYVINNKNDRAPMPNGYHFEMWKQDPGNVKMTVFNNEARFDVEWQNIQNFVARVGLVYDETQTHQEIGTFTADVAFQKSSIQNGLAYFGIYGWTVEPLVEYYIMEDWVNWRPQGGDGNHESKGTITVDGAQYDVVTRQMQNQPSIKDVASFPQVFSIRKQTRTGGSISVSEHFKQWEKMGIKLGKMYEVKIKVESYNGQNQSTGSAKVTKGVIKVNGQIPTATIPFRGEIAGKRPVHTDLITNQNAYTLISLTGQKIMSTATDPSQQPVFSKNNVAPGIYLLQSKVNGATLETRSFLVK